MLAPGAGNPLACRGTKALQYSGQRCICGEKPPTSLAYQVSKKKNAATINQLGWTVKGHDATFAVLLHHQSACAWASVPVLRHRDSQAVQILTLHRHSAAQNTTYARRHIVDVSCEMGSCSKSQPRHSTLL